MAEVAEDGGAGDEERVHRVQVPPLRSVPGHLAQEDGYTIHTPQHVEGGPILLFVANFGKPSAALASHRPSRSWINYLKFLFFL